MTRSHLEFRRLRRGFGRLQVLKDISGEVREGEALLVTGANGSGKSTLLRCLAGLLAPEAGTITYREKGEELATFARRRRVGYLAPDLTFYEELSALENLAFFARLRGVPRERCARLLERVGLPPERSAGALSSGMRQRLRWVFALLHRPALLLLDEPFQNLDPPGTAEAGRLVEEHLANGGLAVVASPSGLDLPGVTAELVLDS